MNISLLPVVSVSVLLGYPQAPPQAPSRPAGVALDEKLIEVARVLPGFGGMYVDEKGDLNVYMVEGPTPLSAAAAEARRGQVDKALRQVLGDDILMQLAPRRSPQGQEQATPTPLRITIVKGNYDILQLASWRSKVESAVGTNGVVFTDLDERNNRLKIGIVPGTPRERIEAAIKESGVPAEAVLIEETQPVYFQATLRSKVRPMPGGVQVESDTGVFSYSLCTMGFNAIRAGVAGFVTNSHCTKTRGGSEGTDFHQPNDPWWTEGNKVGDEIADPEFFTGGLCPVGRRCRFSDSAFVDYSIARGSAIARTTGWNTGSLEISSTNPRLAIVGEISAWVDGSELDKIGRTTGWTYGRVNGTCQNTNVTDTDITLLCQFRVNRIPGHTHKMVDKGDSGSPVFRWMGSTTLLSGILWGGPKDNSSFVFSPMNQIEQELGELTTFNFPQPQPSEGQCPTGQRCCEIEIVNNKPKCVLCVPNNAECP